MAPIEFPVRLVIFSFRARHVRLERTADTFCQNQRRPEILGPADRVQLIDIPQRCAWQTAEYGTANGR